MLDNVPRKYAKVTSEWQAALEEAGAEGAKILWNFRNESRVNTEVSNRFFKNLDQKYTGAENPIEIIEDCIDENMVMRGPQPMGDLPETFCRAVTITALQDQIKRETQVTYSFSRVIKRIKNGDILDDLPEFICNRLNFVWIACLEDVEPICNKCDPDNLRNSLGLYHFEKGETIVIMTIKIQAIKKDGQKPFIRIPTVMEGGSASAFTPAEENEEKSGFLIDLEDGKPTVPEWVCAKVAKKGIKFLQDFLDEPDKIKLKTDPPNDFWQRYVKMVH